MCKSFRNIFDDGWFLFAKPVQQYRSSHCNQAESDNATLINFFRIFEALPLFSICIDVQAFEQRHLFVYGQRNINDFTYGNANIIQ